MDGNGRLILWPNGWRRLTDWPKRFPLEPERKGSKHETNLHQYSRPQTHTTDGEQNDSRGKGNCSGWADSPSSSDSDSELIWCWRDVSSPLGIRWSNSSWVSLDPSSLDVLSKKPMSHTKVQSNDIFIRRAAKPVRSAVLHTNKWMVMEIRWFVCWPKY